MVKRLVVERDHAGAETGLDGSIAGPGPDGQPIVEVVAEPEAAPAKRPARAAKPVATFEDPEGDADGDAPDENVSGRIKDVAKGSAGLFGGVLRAGYRLLRDTVQTPTQFIVLILLLLALVYLSVSNVAFGIGLVLFLWFGGLWVYARERRFAGEKVARIPALVITAIVLTATGVTALYLDADDFTPAHLPAKIIEPKANNGWVLSSEQVYLVEGKDILGARFAAPAKVGIVAYQNQVDERYAGLLDVISVKIRVPGYFSTASMEKRLDQQIIDSQQDGSIRIILSSRTVSYITTKDGHSAKMWTYDAEIEGAASTGSVWDQFIDGAKVKIVAAVWECPDSGVYVGIGGGAAWGAKTTTTGPPGQVAQTGYPDNLSTWYVALNLIKEVRCD